MKLCLDMTSIGVPHERWTGVARMSWELALALATQPLIELSFSTAGTLHAQEMTERHLASGGLGDRFAGPPLGRPTLALLATAERGGGTGLVAAQVLRCLNLLRRPVAQNHLSKLDAYFSFYAGLPRQLRGHPQIRRGIYVHDLIPFLLPEYCTEKQRAVLGRILRSIRPDDVVAVNSDRTRRDLAQWLARDPDTIHTVPLAADPAVFYRVTDPAAFAQLRARYALPDGPYVLSLHNAAPHKNMPMLIRAHATYRRRTGGAALPLVIAGGKGDPRSEIAAVGGLMATDLDGITFLGFVADADLAPLYSGAQAFFFPSLYEGFGLPVLEALFCGVPVFAADRASLPEIMAPLTGAHAGADRLLPADDPEAWVGAFVQAETLAPLDAPAIAEVREHFSWARAAANLAALLKSDCVSPHVSAEKDTIA